jgi:uncharacterized protein (DUF2147 family)
MKLRSFLTLVPLLIPWPCLAAPVDAPLVGEPGGPRQIAGASNSLSHADFDTALDNAAKGDELLGEWWTEGKEGRVKIVKTKSGLFEVVLLDGKDVDKKDENNPEPKLRERKLRGIVLMWNLRFDGEEYVDGYCYNPRDGETYRVKMKITGPSTLRLRGYLAVPLLGQSQDWTRAK